MALSGPVDRHLLSVTARMTGSQPQFVTLRADAQQPLSAHARRVNEMGSLRAVCVDDGNAIGRQDLREEAQLRLPVGVERCVIIQMVTRQVGEPGRTQPNTIDAILRKPVAG